MKSQQRIQITSVVFLLCSLACLPHEEHGGSYSNFFWISSLSTVAKKWQYKLGQRPKARTQNFPTLLLVLAHQWKWTENDESRILDYASKFQGTLHSKLTLQAECIWPKLQTIIFASRAIDSRTMKPWPEHAGQTRRQNKVILEFKRWT